MLNLIADGTCPYKNQRVSTLATTNSNCAVRSNKTSGQIINPVWSARLTTAGKKTIKYGEFAGTNVNGTVPNDPWSQTGRDNTPFDQPFYLILSVAVGATSSWFP